MVAEIRVRGPPLLQGLAGFGGGLQPAVPGECAVSRGSSTRGFLGQARLISPPVTWELAPAGGVGGETMCPGARVDSGGHREAIQRRTKELTFASTLLSLAWLLFKFEFTQSTYPSHFSLPISGFAV